MKFISIAQTWQHQLFLTIEDPTVNEFYDELLRHWTLRPSSPTTTPLIDLIDLAADDELGMDLSSMFDVKKEVGTIEDGGHLEYELMDPYYSLENGLHMGDEDVEVQGKGGSEDVGKAAEPSVVEAAEPSVVEAAEPSVGEAAEPSVVQAAEPSVGVAAEPVGDSKPHGHQQPLEGSGPCMTPKASTTKQAFTPLDGLSDADIATRIAHLKWLAGG